MRGFDSEVVSLILYKYVPLIMQKSCINVTNQYCTVNNWWRYKAPGHKGLVTPSGSQSSRPHKSYRKKTTRKEKQNTCPDFCFFAKQTGKKEIFSGEFIYFALN